MRFLIATNVLILLEPTGTSDVGALTPEAIDFARIASEGGHQLYVHPQACADIRRDTDPVRRGLRGTLIRKYPSLPDPPALSSRLVNVLGRPEPQRMGGARSGKEIGEGLMEAGTKEDEAIRRVIDFMNCCKVGKVTLGETVRMRENCESMRTKLFTAMEEPSCYFTTGFLNGLFSAVKNQHVREIRSIAAGDRYCEWEVR